MSRFLADTHILLWAAAGSRRLPKEAAMAIEDGAHDVYFSLASIWEVAIKFSLGRSDFNVPPDVLRDELLESGFREIPITSHHIMAVAVLPGHHRDPFDRILVAQAQTEGLTLMTADKTLARYGSSVRRFR